MTLAGACKCLEQEAWVRGMSELCRAVQGC
jgi:hypothetical protein